MIAEPILNKTDQKLFNRSTILLWRVEQLFRLSVNFFILYMNICQNAHEINVETYSAKKSSYDQYNVLDIEYRRKTSAFCVFYS